MEKKIFFILRLYTGFENSLKNKNWEPEGVPTIYNIINQLSIENELTIFLTCKDSGKTFRSTWMQKKDTTIVLSGLNAKFVVLSGVTYFPDWLPTKFKMIMRDLRQLIVISYSVSREKPDLLYCDQVNIMIAFFLKNLFPKIPLILRILGICAHLKKLIRPKSLLHIIYKKAFGGNYECVIGTQDGTGTEYFLSKMIKESVPTFTLLNGTKTKESINFKGKLKGVENIINLKEKTIILFIGRLEEAKGIRVFTKACLSVCRRTKLKLCILIVGDGSLHEEMRRICAEDEYGKNVIFTGAVQHKYIAEYHKIADIYVSANSYGNLSNANLEAISENACMLIPEPQPELDIDQKTTELLRNCVKYYKFKNIDDLSDKLIYLINNPTIRKELKERISKEKLNFMRSWQERVKEEEEIINNILCERKNVKNIR